MKKCKGRGKAIKGRHEEERKPRSLGGEIVIRCRRTAFSLFARAVGQPSLSLILFHIERTSSSDLPILVEITRHENRDFSSAFKVRSFCLSSKVQIDNGLEERDLDLSGRRRRFAGALGTALAFCLRFGGDGVVVESFEGAGRTSGDGAATW